MTSKRTSPDALTLHFIVTDKQAGKRQAMHEIGVYSVRDGKIAAEIFYYAA